MNRDYSFYLKDMLAAINSIYEFTHGMSLEEFSKDDKTLSAVIRKFEILGEAAKKIPNNLKEKYSEIPWKDICGMRDKLIHEYFGINIKILWNTIQINLKPLKILLEKIVSEINS